MPSQKNESFRPSGGATKKAPPRNSAPVNKQANKIVNKQSAETRKEAKAGIVDTEDHVIGGGFQSVQEIHDALPEFLQNGKLMDKNRNKPDSPNFDPTTIHIPAIEWKNFTPGMYQYWEIKQTNFEKLFFFKLGKFYEIFYQDAIICQRLLDLNWMGGGKKLHVGFPEKALDKYLQIMVQHGFKVAVVEQTETPR